MSSPYGVGVLGLGVIGRWVSEALAESDRFTVVAAFDPAPREQPSFQMLTTAEAVARHPEVDCLYIASPPRYHAEGVALAIEHGKAVLCEKPLAPTAAEAERLAAQVAAAGLPNMVNFASPTIPAGRALARAVDGNLLGRVEAAEIWIRVRDWPQAWHAEAGAWLTTPEEGGFTREVATHFLGLADRLLGAGRLVRADVQRAENGLETRAVAEIDYGGVPLTLDAGLDPEVNSPDDMTSRVTLRCQGGDATIEDWTRVLGFGIEVEDEVGLAQLLAAVLAGDPADVLDFGAGARVAGLIEGILER